MLLTASHMSSPCFQNSSRSAPGGVLYAEHTRTSRRPSASLTRASTRSRSASSPTSHCKASPRPPATVISSAVASTVRSDPGGRIRSFD
eukprot:scaffold20938_cov116-Isochrysis_galbana.AAC.5